MSELDAPTLMLRGAISTMPKEAQDRIYGTSDVLWDLFLEKVSAIEDKGERAAIISFVATKIGAYLEAM